MKKTWIFVVILVVVVGVVYWLVKDRMVITQETFIITLGSQNDSNESGKATLTSEGDNTKVVLEMNGTPTTTPQPAHIHLGACPTPGAVKYPLTNVVNGKSTSVINVTLEMLKASLPLAINVHKSADEASVYVSCGDLL